MGASQAGIFDIFGCRACDDRDCTVIRKGHRPTQATPGEKILRYHDRCHRVVQRVRHVGYRRRGWRGIPRPAIAAIRAYGAVAEFGTAAAVIADAVRGPKARWIAFFAAKRRWGRGGRVYAKQHDCTGIRPLTACPASVRGTHGKRIS